MSIRYRPYQERLRLLELPSLYHRRRRGDMVTVYKLFHGGMGRDGRGMWRDGRIARGFFKGNESELTGGRMETVQTSGENAHPQICVQHKNHQRLELAALIGGVSRDTQ